MNNQQPIRTFTQESKLSDGVEINVIGEVYEKPIYPGGELVYNLVKLLNKQTGISMGVAFFRDPMDQEELEAKVNEICKDPEPYLAPVYRKQLNN